MTKPVRWNLEVAMQFKTHRYLSLFFSLFLFSCLPVCAQSNAESKGRLFIRYEHGAAPNRIIEDVLTLTLSVSSKARESVAIRLCSREPMPFALATAGGDPFLIADLLVNAYAYPPERVIFLRSEDCLLSGNQSEPITEIWAIPDGASLPSHVEALKFNQVRRVSLGKRTANRGVRDYRAAVQRLIQDLRANPSSAGVVFGYFLERPSPVLRRRLREVTRIFQQSGLPADRYLVRPMRWNDEASTIPPDSEPQYPSVFVVEAVKGKDSARK
jgi:hypothetical protein